MIADGPGYWMHETTGVLRPAVIAYFAGSMSPEQVAALRAYLRQWIEAPVWAQAAAYADARDRIWLISMWRRVDDLDSIEVIRDWIDEATDAGMDPL